MSTNGRASPTRSLLLGKVWWRTRRALVLTAGFLIGAAMLRAFAPGSPLHACCHHLVFAAVQGFVDLTGNGYFTENGIVGLALFGMGSLAAINAYLNEGYLPSIILAAAPAYGFYVFNGPGAGPVWAAGIVLPYAVLYGTIGFLIGMGLRQLRSEQAPPTLSRSTGE